MRSVARYLAVIFCVTVSAQAGEYAILHNGFRIHADRHEVDGSEYVLYSASGHIRLPVAQVTSFEQEEYVPPPSPAILPSTPGPNPVISAPISPAARIERAVERQGLSKDVARLAVSVAKIESGLRQDVVSPKGAIGTMQLMPATAAALNADPHDPDQNVDAGVRYLRDLLVKYQDYGDEQVARALAAYNAGPGAVDRYQGVPPYRETQKYVQKVIENYKKVKP